MTTLIYSNRTIEWSPIIAGTIVACATSFVLLQFGQALGLSFSNLGTRETITPSTVLVFGLWTLWVQISASVTGAYLAGRMLNPWENAHESELRDGAHGLLVWALSTVLVALAIGAAAGFAALAVHHGVDVNSKVSDVMAKRITIISGFSLAAISLVSAVIAWFTASVAGDHRDRRVDVVRYTTFRRTALKM